MVMEDLAMRFLSICESFLLACSGARRQDKALDEVSAAILGDSVAVPVARSATGATKLSHRVYKVG